MNKLQLINYSIQEILRELYPINQNHPIASKEAPCGIFATKLIHEKESFSITLSYGTFPHFKHANIKENAKDGIELKEVLKKHAMRLCAKETLSEQDAQYIYMMTQFLKRNFN